MEKVLKTLEEQVAPGHTALIIIDPQNDFCASDGACARVMGLDVSRVQAAVGRLNPFIEQVRRVGLPVIWVRHVLDIRKCRPNEKALHGEGEERFMVRPDGEGSKWYTEMVPPLPDEPIITKRHYDAFSDTDLSLLLDGLGIKTVVLTGFITNVCVETAARHAYTRGYYVVLASDCTDTYAEREYASSVYNIGHHFGKAATSAELLAVWDKDN